MRKFDFYEFAGILVPGTLFLAGLVYFWPGVIATDSMDKISIGGLGLFTLLAYVSGHLIQAIGNWIEKIWWVACRGMPTDWIRSGKGTLLAPAQTQKLRGDLQHRLGLSLPENLKELSAGEWVGIVRQVYAAVAGAKRASRVDTFNGNYGLHRGLVAAALLLLIVSPMSDVTTSTSTVILVIVAAVGTSRMHLFGKHYARELFAQFLQLPAGNAVKERK